MRFSLPAFVLAFGFASAYFPCCVAQQGATEALGMVPGASFQRNDVDNVNIANRNSVIRIPLFSLPQLGKLDLSFSIAMNTSLWEENTTCTSTGYCTYSYNPNSGVGNFAIGGIGFGPQIVEDQGYTMSWYTEKGEYYAGEPDGYPAYFHWAKLHFRALDSAGGLHPMYYDNANPSQLRSIDGSKLLYKPSTSQPYNWAANWTTGSGTIIDSEGTRYVIDSNGSLYFNAQIIDTLGNTITDASGIITDSVGRTLTGAPGAAATQSTAGCPNLSTEASYQPLTGSSTWTVPGPNGSNSTYLICYASVTVRTNFWGNNGQAIIGQNWQKAEWDDTVSAIQSIVLPNGSYWAFLYDSANPSNSSSFGYGTLQTLIYPTGGSVTYGYATDIGCTITTVNSADVYSWLTRHLISRTENDANGHSSRWTYAATSVLGASNILNEQVTLTDPVGDDTVYLFDRGLSTSTCDFGGERSRATYQGAFASSKSAIGSKTTINALTPPPSLVVAPEENYAQSLPTSSAMSVDGNAISTSTPGYDNFFSAVDILCWTTTGVSPACQFSSPQVLSLGIQQSTTTTSATSSLSRTVANSYLWQTGSQASAYLEANILDAVSTVTTTGVPGGTVTQTTYGYDEKNGSPQGVYGLRTSATTWLNTGSVSPESSTVYNSLGMPTLKIDPNSGQTAFQNYACGGLFPQTVIQAYQSKTTTSETTSYTYDCDTGHITSVTNPNGVVTNYQYADPLGRLTLVDGAVGTTAETTASYAYPTATSITSAQDLRAKGDGLLKSSVHSDGLGQVVDRVGPDGSQTATTYDYAGRILSVSNPYQATSDSTYGITSYLYDALGRKTYQCQPDNTTAPSTTCVPTNSYQSWSYNGNVTTFTDENGNQWQRTTDALGRLTQVLEPSATSASPTLATGYAYDANNNLLKVTQSGVSGTDAARVRTFTYDSLSRLLCASNPESSNSATPQVTCPASATASMPAGTTRYTYDANGNVSSKTDTRGITVNYGYDALNRLLSKSSAGYLSSCFQYDGSASNNQVGRLVYEWTQTGTCPAPPALPSAGFFTLRSITSYDPTGRITSEQQCVPGDCTTSSGPALGYTYDLAGNPTTLTNSVGAAGGPLTLTSTFDTGAHLSSVVSGWTAYPTALYTVPAGGYGPVGPLNWTLGPNLTVTQGYDNRLRVNGIAAQGQVP